MAQVSPTQLTIHQVAERRARAYCPWRDLARRRGVELAWHAGREMGLTRFSQLRVSLRAGMTEAETRTTLAHELIHLERGPADDKQLEEVQVRQLTAKRLIDPVLWDELAVGADLPIERLTALLGADEHAVRAYAAWRNKVKASTARLIWDRAQVPTLWPPKWVEAPRYADARSWISAPADGLVSAT